MTADDRTPLDLDRLLGPSPEAVAPAELRERLRRQTTRVLRARRWGRRLGLVAALAACYALGVLTVRVWPARAPAVADAPRPPEQEPRVARATPRDPIRPVRSPGRAALLRQAGDRYLEKNDLAAAVRCYRLALDAGSDDELTIQANDNWLLMALKDARRKEQRHDARDG
jgi:hypothetical protein